MFHCQKHWLKHTVIYCQKLYEFIQKKEEEQQQKNNLNLERPSFNEPGNVFILITFPLTKNTNNE